MEIQLPAEFTKRMSSQLGADFELYTKSLTDTPPTSIRWNPHKAQTISQQNCNDKVLWEPMGEYLPSRPVFTLDPLLHAGAYYVQEASSMFVGYVAKQIIPNNEKATILDLCAAPGGKSTHLASIFDSKQLLVCNEVIGSRVAVLCENITKWGNPNVIVTNNDAKDFKALVNFFDLVVVDAPCSGEGLFRREPLAINEWSPQNTELCAQRQQRIIADIWDSIKPGGYLIYSTCTFCPQENEENMAWIAKTFDAKNIAINIDDKWNITPIEKNNCIGYRFIQHKTKGEGFFCCVFQKNNETKNTITKWKIKNQNTLAPKSLAKNLTKLTTPDYQFDYYIKNNIVIGCSQEFNQEITLLQNKLKVVKSGVAIAKLFGEKFTPEHDLAMSWAINNNEFDCIDLSLRDALSYLHRDNIFIANSKIGCNLVTYQNTPLGFIKNIGQRWNNLYPQNWKIKMNIPNEL